MATTKKTGAAEKPPTLRDRLKKSSDQTTAALSPELTEKLIALPEKLVEAGESVVLKMNETAERSALRLSEIVEAAGRSSRTTEAILPRLSELQEHMTETERNVAFQVERLKRQADRAQWMQTGVILLALVAGLLGGIGAALVMLNWIR
jgi:hypothetical protein